MTAVNDEGGQINVAKDIDGSEDTIPKTMQKYQSRQEPWMLVVDDNCEFPVQSFTRSCYTLSLAPTAFKRLPQTRFVCQSTPLIPDGEGSAREHAALQPRFYGCGMIVARSFARIHETNLKKQGILPLWLMDKSSYSDISAHDKVQTVGMADILAGKSTTDKVVLKVTKPDGSVKEVECRHTLSTDQVEWLRAGSALNWIGEVARQRGTSA